MFVRNNSFLSGSTEAGLRHSRFPLLMAEAAQRMLDPAYQQEIGVTPEQAQAESIKLLNLSLEKLDQNEKTGQFFETVSPLSPAAEQYMLGPENVSSEQVYSEIAYTMNLIREQEQAAAIAQQEQALQAQVQAQYEQAIQAQEQQAQQIIAQQTANAQAQREAEARRVAEFQAQLQANAEAQRRAIEENTARLRAENEAARKAADEAMRAAQEAARMQQAGLLTEMQLAQAEQERIRAQNAALAAAQALAAQQAQQAQQQAQGAVQQNLTSPLVPGGSSGGGSAGSSGGGYDPGAPGSPWPDDRKSPTSAGASGAASPGLGLLALLAVGYMLTR